MKRFFQYLRLARLFSRCFPYIEEAEDDSYWSENDAIALEYFFRSTTGVKLKNRLANYAIRSAMGSVMQPNTSNFQRDVAAGIQMTIAAIDNHLPAHVPTDMESEQSESQAALDRLENATA